MKCAVTVHSITHLVEAGMADAVVAEVKRLEKESADWRRREHEAVDKCQVLAAENERLRKAGDAMAYIMEYEKDNEFDGFVAAWNAAKEGGAK